MATNSAVSAAISDFECKAKASGMPDDKVAKCKAHLEKTAEDGATAGFDPSNLIAIINAAVQAFLTIWQMLHPTS